MNFKCVFYFSIALFSCRNNNTIDGLMFNKGKVRPSMIIVSHKYNIIMTKSYFNFKFVNYL